MNLKSPLFNLSCALAITLPALIACASVPFGEALGQNYDQVDARPAPEIIFIHGMFMTPKCWDNWIENFKAEGFEVSAPAWPFHQDSVEQQRDRSRLKALGELQLSDVLVHYRKLIQGKARKPILIGHSMGGLVAQILLSEGLAEATIAIDSAPPKGISYVNLASLKANWGIINPFASPSRPIEMDFREFSFAFTNEQGPAEQERAYKEFYVPESRRVGKAPLTEAARVNTTKPRGPLLLIAGGEDHIIPEKLTYKNFKLYREAPAYTEFVLFPGRDHWTIAGRDWEQVAETALNWIRKHYSSF